MPNHRSVGKKYFCFNGDEREHFPTKALKSYGSYSKSPCNNYKNQNSFQLKQFIMIRTRRVKIIIQTIHNMDPVSENKK